MQIFKRCGRYFCRALSHKLGCVLHLGECDNVPQAVRAEKLLDSVIALGATGSFIALEFLLLQAPDVAIAEASVGAVLSTVLFIIALRKANADKEEQK